MASGKREEEFKDEASKTMNLSIRLTACLKEILEPLSDIEVYEPTGYLSIDRGDLFPTVDFV